MGIPINEEGDGGNCQLASEMQSTMDDSNFLDFPRKKKLFSSSSFYEEPNAIYPTIEEQVELCRKIADSLSQDCNKKSRGANMFFKRVKKAEKWVVSESTANNESTQKEYEYSSSSDPTSMPYVKVSKEPPRLKLILDPRHPIDMKRLRQEGVDIVEHNTLSPEICRDLIKDLNSPKGKGAQLFAKRKKKSEEWVVDEEKVRNLLRKSYGSSDSCDSPEPDELPIKPLTHPRVQMIKSPWETPSKPVHSQDVADSVIKAAEAKIMSYPAPMVPIIEPGFSKDDSFDTRKPQLAGLQRSATTVLTASGTCRTDIYTSRAPRGWMKDSSTYSITESKLSSDDSPLFSLSPVPPSGTPLPSEPVIPRTFNFTNFNSTPKAWGADVNLRQPGKIKSVRPPSLLLQ